MRIYAMTEIFDDIKKLYRFYVPDNELADYIEFFSESSAPETYRYVANNRFTIKMFPSWTPTFYINLGEPYQLTVGATPYLIQKSTDVLILRNSIVERHNLPTDHIFTVKFYPGGLEAILGINQVQLVDQVVHLDTILPPAFLQRVKQCVSFEERLDVLQPFFLQHFKGKQKADHYRQIVTNTIDAFDSSGMVVNTGQLAERMFSTSKTLNRYFHRVVGTPPKNYFTTLRARHALIRYVANKNQFAPEAYGYYDMSHFYKDVLKFTGRKLSENLT